MAAALSQPALFALDPQLLLHDKALLWRLAIETGFMAATLAAVLLVRPALRRLTVILARHAGPTLSPLTTPLAKSFPGPSCSWFSGSGGWRFAISAGTFDHSALPKASRWPG